MAEAPRGGNGSPLRLLILAAVVAALVGAVAGFTVGAVVPRAPVSTPQSRELFVFTTTLAFNETYLNLPHDVFSPDHLTVWKGDDVTIHFYNTEEGEVEQHTFTMTAPYEVNKVVANGQNATITFVANSPGTFAYRCTLHQPTMTGYIVVNG